MPTIKDLWPDRWLRPDHLGNKRAIVMIEDAGVESLYNPRTKKHEPRLVIAFAGKQLRLPLNKTQAHAVASIARDEDYTTWRGCKVVLSVTRAPNGADTILISPVPDTN